VTVLVGLETLLLALMALLVAGLLRSHAEILRRLGPDGDGAARLPEPPTGARERAGGPAPALAGSTPSGDAVRLAFEGGSSGPVLLAFLTTGCSTCAGFWDGLGDGQLPAGVQPVIVSHGTERESPARLGELAPDGVPVVMSSEAWRDYQVPGAPYFVLVDGSIRGEGAATAWPALASLVRDALADEAATRPSLDATFAAAGIGPDDQSLYPGDR
jgi:hypothetical protein